MKRINKKRRMGRKIAGLILLLIETVLTVLFSIVLIKYNIFSWSLIILIIIFLLAMLFIVFRTQRRRADGLQLFGMILSIIMCIVMAVGSYYFLVAGKTLNSITDQTYSVKLYQIVVLKDDPAETMEDTIDYKYGTAQALDSNTHFISVMVELTNELGAEVDTNDYTGVSQLYDALMNGKVQAIFYENSYDNAFAEIDEDYESKVKVVGEINVKQASAKVQTTTVDVLKSPFIVFLSGGDDYFELSTTGRCDAVVLAVVNPNTSQILLCSIPRDYYVQFPGVTGEERDKLTHSGIYGIDVTIDTLNELLDIEINYYFRVNFSSMIEIVDAIGGVEVYNEYEFDAPDDELNFPQGNITLSGFEALQYARERYTLARGDFARQEHQQVIIEALINKLTKPTTLALNYTSLMEALDDSALTNMTNDDILGIIRNQISTGQEWNISKVIALGETVYQPSYAMGGMSLAMCMPYAESVEYVSSLIHRIQAGEIIKDVTEYEPTTYTYITDLVSTEYDDWNGYTDDNGSDGEYYEEDYEEDYEDEYYEEDYEEDYDEYYEEDYEEDYDEDYGPDDDYNEDD